MDIFGKCNLKCLGVGKDKKIKVFEVTFAQTDGNGKYMNHVGVRVMFSKLLMPDNVVDRFMIGHSYPYRVTQGFITTRGYETRTGEYKKELVLYVQKGETCGEPKPIKNYRLSDTDDFDEDAMNAIIEGVDKL